MKCTINVKIISAKKSTLQMRQKILKMNVVSLKRFVKE